MNLIAAGHRVVNIVDALANRVHVAAVPRPSDGRLRQVVRHLGGRKVRLLVRDDTNDIDLIDMILRPDGEYALPAQLKPKVIFDVGANIGVAAVYYATLYPEAHIYCFEPLPANVDLLRRNTAGHSDRIHVVPRGLGDRAGELEYHMSDDPRSFGGGTFCTIGHDPSRAIKLPVGTVADALDEFGVDHVDVFKIDTEGSEMAILRAMPDHVRRSAQAIVGELHGIDDWDACRLLSESHALAINKRYDRGCFTFLAVRQDLASRAVA